MGRCTTAGRPSSTPTWYSPLFAQAITPLGWLPWHGFQAVWLALGVAAAVWLVRPLPVRWAVPVFLFCVPDLVIGNVYTFLALMVALGARHSTAWLFGVLTKVTPGVGLVWLAARHDWRAVGVAAVVGAVLVGLSWTVAPDAWAGWLHLLISGTGGDPSLVPRCVVAVGLAVAARDRPWLLAVAVVMATPVFNAAACLVPLAAIPRLWQHAAHEDSGESRGDDGRVRATRRGRVAGAGVRS